MPLCASHHRALHTVGDEERWWKERQVDPIILAEQLWRERWSETVQQPSRAREPISPGPIKISGFVEGMRLMVKWNGYR